MASSKLPGVNNALPREPSPPGGPPEDTVLLADLPSVPADPAPTISQIGRYDLKLRIGAGGLGTVYAADDPLLSRRVAIKTLDLGGAGVAAPLETQARRPFDEMFLHEARAAAQLSHPYIVTVFDAGLSQTPGQGAYIAMELLKGKDLRALLAEGWRPTPAQAALIVRRVADALAYAHSKGVVHRDVKPANIFMVGRTQPKVLDFGIASIAHAHDGAVAAGGSPHYMAPEQVRGEATDRRTDVFSLGVVLYELLCGRRAFDGASLEAITAAVCTQQPPPAHELAPEVPPALSAIAERAMAKRPDERTRSARALAHELQQWLQGHPDALQHAEDEAGGPPRWRRAAWPLAGTAFVALLGLGVWQRMADAPGAADAPRNAQATRSGADATRVLEPARTTPSRDGVEATRAAATPAGTEATRVAGSPRAAAAAESAQRAAPAAQPAAEPVAQPATERVAQPATEPVARPATLPVARPEQEPAAGPATATAVKAAPPVADGPTAATAAIAEAAPEATAPAAAPGAARGTLQLAVSPWAEVAVDGKPVGVAPPLSQLSLPAGRHTVTLRNSGHPTHTATVTVAPDETAVVRYRFGP